MRMIYKGTAMAYESTAAKKPVNLSVNSDLLRQAKELKVNVSQVLEVALASQVKRLREAQWLEANKEAIDAYNRQVEENGLPFDGVRQRLWSGLTTPEAP
jgi:antitoxin CcdA